MTEDEARQKWCPFARVAMISSSDIECPPCNRLAIDGVSGLEKNPAGARCIASDCMAWRWHTSPAQAVEINARGNAGAKAHGVCGLAGK